MGPHLASVVDFLHALAMVVWVGGIPLLFWHRWPRLSRGYVVFCILFIVTMRVSDWLLGECFLTTLSRALWQWGSPDPSAAPREWFTVRFADFIFGLRPARRSVILASEALLLLCAVGMLVYLWRARRRPRRARRLA